MFSSGLGGGLVGNAPLFPALAEADDVSILLQAIASEPSGTQGAQSGGVPVSQAGQTQAAVIASALQALVGTQASTEAAAVAVLLPALLETVALHDESFLSSIVLASGLRPAITLPGLLLSGSAMSSVATAVEKADRKGGV